MRIRVWVTGWATAVGLASIVAAGSTAAGPFDKLINALDGNIGQGQFTAGINDEGAQADLRAENTGDASGSDSTIMNAAAIAATQQGGNARFQGAVTLGENRGVLDATATNRGDATDGGAILNCAAIACGQAASR